MVETVAVLGRQVTVRGRDRWQLLRGTVQVSGDSCKNASQSLQVSHYMSVITGQSLQVSRHRTVATGRSVQVSRYRLVVTSQSVQVSRYRLVVTSQSVQVRRSPENCLYIHSITFPKHAKLKGI